MSLKSLACTCVLLLVAGCSLTNRSTAVDTIAKLPDGGLIRAELESASGTSGPSVQRVVWHRADGAEKALHVAPANALDSAATTIAGAEPRFSNDLQKVWLVRNGQVVASFDYAGAKAVFGTSDQPPWAKP